MATSHDDANRQPESQESPRERRRQAARERIIAAAREIVLERTTADSLSLREVARRADFTPGALYRYFQNRQDLLKSLFAEALAVLTAYMKQATAIVTAAESAAGRSGAGEGPNLASGAATPRNVNHPVGPAELLAVGEAYLRFGRERPEDLALIFQSAAHVSSWKEYVGIAHPFSGLVRAMQTGEREGTLVLPEGLDAAGAAYAYWCLLHGIAELQRVHLRALNEELAPIQRATLRHFVASLTPATAPHSTKESS